MFKKQKKNPTPSYNPKPNDWPIIYSSSSKWACPLPISFPSPRSSLSRLPSSLLGRLHGLPDFALCRLCWVYSSHEEVKNEGRKKTQRFGSSFERPSIWKSFPESTMPGPGRPGRGQRGLVYKYVFWHIFWLEINWRGLSRVLNIEEEK